MRPVGEWTAADHKAALDRIHKLMDAEADTPEVRGNGARTGGYRSAPSGWRQSLHTGRRVMLRIGPGRGSP